MGDNSAPMDMFRTPSGEGDFGRDKRNRVETGEQAPSIHDSSCLSFNASAGAALF